MYKYLVLYLIVVNSVGVLLNLADKYRAKHNLWRIKERSLWLIAILGGAPFSYITMKIIRHKTKHKSFMIGMPILALLDIIIVGYVFYIMN